MTYRGATMDERTRIQNKVDTLNRLAEDAKANGQRQLYWALRLRLLHEQARLWDLRKGSAS